MGQQIGAEAGVDAVYADLLSERKVSLVRELEARYGPVAMVGDGVDDAPALAAATIGIAMGAAGADVALETADVVLMLGFILTVGLPLPLAVVGHEGSTVIVSLNGPRLLALRDR